MSKYYLDTCIWIDYFEDRSDRFRPLGYWAFCLIRNIVSDKDIVIYSDVVEDELLGFYSEEKVRSLLSVVPENLFVKVNSTKKQSEEASVVSRKLNIPFNDALNAILARDNDSVLVTRDRHFYEFSNVKRPEELV